MSGKRRILVLTRRQQAKPVVSSRYSFGESGDKIKTGRQIKTGEQTPSLRVARSCVFSPVNPHFRGTTGRQQNSLRLFCFLPVNLVFVVAFAPLKVSLWRRMSAVATGIFILTGTTKLSLRRAFARRRRISLFFGLCPKNLPNFFTFHYNL